MRRLAAAAVVGIALVLVTAAPASAHNYVVDSTPAQGSTLTELPEHFSVTTNDPLLDLGGDGSGFGLEVVDANGLYYGDGCVTIEGPSIFMTAQLGEPGEYSLVYQVVSADSHTVSGEIPFTWAPSGDYTATAGSTNQGDCNGQYTRDNSAGAASADQTVDVSTLLWIGGAIAAVGIAVAVALLVLKPKR